MGADLTGYLVKGPLKIAASRVVVAVRACRHRRRELLALTGPQAERHDRMDAALSATGEYVDPAEIAEDPEPEVRDFVAGRHDIGGRDTCCRRDPDDNRQQLVYAGEMSWGDEPQGQGYKKLKQAFAWGYAEALGIR
jgi:hypothetical protein